MKKNSYGTPKQWSCVAIIAVIGMAGFFLMAGEDDINNPMPTDDWLLLKGLGLTLFIVCIILAKLFARVGLLPEFDEED